MTTTFVPAPGTSQPEPAPKRFTLDLGILVVIVLLVGIMAGAASFNHVHDFTLKNSPDNTPGWFGWANAVISELIPTASLIEIARRRRRNTSASVRYPMFLLVSAVGFSLTAQLAVAKPTVFGWMVSALPALAFFALSKLVFSTTTARPTNPVATEEPATSPATSSDSTRAKVRPAAAAKTRATKSTPAKKTPAKRTPAKKTAPAPATTVPADITPVPVPALVSRPAENVSDRLLANARTIAIAHRDDHGEDINPNQLAVWLRVPTQIASDILTQLATNPTLPANTKPHNGSAIGATA